MRAQQLEIERLKQLVANMSDGPIAAAAARSLAPTPAAAPPLATPLTAPGSADGGGHGGSGSLKGPPPPPPSKVLHVRNTPKDATATDVESALHSHGFEPLLVVKLHERPQVR